MLKSFLQENRSFVSLQFSIALLASYPLLFCDKLTLFAKLNSYHHPFLDHFFYYATFLGGTIFYVILVVILSTIRQESSILLVGIANFVIISILVQGLKHTELFDQARPISFLSETEVAFHLVKGITHRTYWSFPSGHSAAIFAAVWLAYLQSPTKSWWLSFTLCLTACLVAYSRVYLCQHFYRDIYVGALIGTLTTIIVYNFFKYRYNSSWLDSVWSYLVFLRGK